MCFSGQVTLQLDDRFLQDNDDDSARCMEVLEWYFQKWRSSLDISKHGHPTFLGPMKRTPWRHPRTTNPDARVGSLVVEAPRGQRLVKVQGLGSGVEDAYPIARQGPYHQDFAGLSMLLRCRDLPTWLSPLSPRVKTQLDPSVGILCLLVPTLRSSWLQSLHGNIYTTLLTIPHDIIASMKSWVGGEGGHVS